PRGEVKLPAGISPPRQPTFAELAQRLLLAEHAPAAVLINRRHEILFSYGPTTGYLEQPAGGRTRDLLLLARHGLPGKLRAAVQQAIHDGQRVSVSGVRVQRPGTSGSVRVTVQPVATPFGADGLLLVTFQDEAGPALPQPSGRAAGTAEGLVRHLERELKATREEVQSMIQDLESANEESKTSNEEMMAVNEELQSANEELETANEELESLNEELATVNSQLQEKVAELEKASTDLANLLRST